MQFDVIIVGGGVLGVSMAYHLARANKRVLVFEQEAAVAHHASGKNAGMIRQLYRHPKLTEWAMRSVQDWPEELRDNNFVQTGSIIVGRKIPGHHEQLFEQRSLITCADHQKRETPCVFSEADGLLDSPGYMYRLFQLAKQSGAEFRFQQRITQLEQSNTDWTVRTADGHEARASWVVNAAGAWLNRFISEDQNVGPVAAQAFARHLYLVEGWQQDYMPSQHCGFYWEENAGWYMRQWDTRGRLVSICDRIAANPDSFSPAPAVAEQLAAKLIDSLPDMSEQLRLGRSWHCFRTYTEDQLPIWGEDPIAKGIFWLGAFGGFGMSTSFAATQDAACYLTGQTVDIPQDFAPSRVQINPFPQQKRAIL